MDPQGHLYRQPAERIPDEDKERLAEQLRRSRTKASDREARKVERRIKGIVGYR